MVQVNLDKVIQDFKIVIGGEFLSYENFGLGDNLKVVNDVVDVLVKVYFDWDEGSFVFVRNIVIVDVIQYQINYINLNDLMLLVQDKVFVINDLVQFVCVQFVWLYVNDKNVEQIYEQIGVVSYDVCVNYIKDQVVVKMKVGDVQGVLKILLINMNDVLVISVDFDVCDYLYQVVGVFFFNVYSDYFNKQISDFIQVYKYNFDDLDVNCKMVDSMVKYDVVGKWMKDLVKVVLFEVVNNLLIIVEDCFNDNGKWFQSNVGVDMLGFVFYGLDFYGGLSLMVVVVDLLCFVSDQLSIDYVQQVVNWLIIDFNVKLFLYSMQIFGLGGSMLLWVLVQNVVGDGNGVIVINVLIQQYGKDLFNVDML